MQQITFAQKVSHAGNYNITYCPNRLVFQKNAPKACHTPLETCDCPLFRNTKFEIGCREDKKEIDCFLGVVSNFYTCFQAPEKNGNFKSWSVILKNCHHNT